MRNIGSSVGISIVMLLLARASQINHAEISARIPAFGAETSLLPALWDPATASGAALLNNEVVRQAVAIGYMNNYWLMMWLTLVGMPLLLLMRPPKKGAAADATDAAANAH